MEREEEIATITNYFLIVFRESGSMSDNAADTSEIIDTSPEARDPFEQPHPRAPSLVPSARSSSKDHIISLLQQAATGAKADPKHAVARARPSIGLQNTQDQPVLDAESGPGDPSEDTLKLLQELARKSSEEPAPDSGDDRPLHAPAHQHDATLQSYLAGVGKIDEFDAAARSAEPQPPARGGTPARFAIVGCFAILAAGITGLFLWSPPVPVPDSESRTETHVAVAAPPERSTVPAGQAPPDMPSVPAAAAECDLAASVNPYAAYFLVSQNALGSNGLRMVARSGEDYGWYSLMSLKARLERRGGGC